MSLESIQFERSAVIAAAGLVVGTAGGTDPVVEACPEQALAAVAPTPVRFCFVVRRIVNQRPIMGRVHLVLPASGTDASGVAREKDRLALGARSPVVLSIRER